MDENTAWSSFLETGSVQDYLLYAQCRDERTTQGAVSDAAENRGDNNQSVPSGGK